jgi:hypothetical protein
MKNRCSDQVGSVFVGLVCAVLLATASCDSEQQVDTPTNQDYDVIARGIAPLLGAELKQQGLLETSTQIVIGDEPGWLSIRSNGKLEGAIGGLTWDVEAECQSAGNQELEVCDESTHKAQLIALVNGNLTLPNYKALLDVDTKWSFDDLQAEIILATGETKITADSEFDSLLTGATRIFQFYLDTEHDFRIPKDAYEATSGTASGTVDAYYSKTGLDGKSIAEGKFVVQAELSLDGHGSAILTLDGIAEYQLDLEAGIAIRI